jgi:hypothetical protein
VSAREHVRDADALYILKCFRKSRDFVHVYSQVEDALGTYALREVQKYKSHRRIFNCQLEREKLALDDGVEVEEGDDQLSICP